MLLDGAILNVIFLGTAALLGFVASALGDPSGVSTAGIVFGVGAWILFGSLYLLTFWALAGQTPGMRLLSIRIEDHDGSPRLGIRRARRRLVGLILALIPFGLGLLGVLTRDDRRGCWDRRAGTDVVPADPLAPYSSRAGAARIDSARCRTGGSPRRRGAESRSRTRRRARRSRRSPSSAPTRCARWSPRPARRSPAGRSSGSRAAPRSCSRRAAGWSPTPSGSSTTICAETGRPADETQFAELSYGLAALEFWARQAPAYLADEEIESASPFVRGRRMVVRYAPLGVVGVIGPWNYPLNNSFGDCIPALAAGNAVVMKPSEVTPLTSLLMAEMLAECGIPEGVFQVATGRGETGAALIDEVDFVMFTGSVATGKKVMAQAAQTLTPVSLELGGKDPMIVLADADLERAANAAVSYGLNNSGQVCISVERIYVEEPVHDEFLERLTEKVRGAAPGPARRAGHGRRRRDHLPAAARADRGPRRATRSTRARRVVTGGERGEGPGRFYRADRAHRRRPLDALHDRGDLRPDPAGDAGRATPSEAIELANDGPLRPAGLGLDPRRRARRADRAPDRGRDGDASTTRSSTTRRSSCRWAAGRSPGSARATAPTGSASTPSASR